MISPRLEVRCTPVAEHGGRFALSDSCSAGVATGHDFSTCLNAFGPAEIVIRAIGSARVSEYPDPYSRAARAAAALRWGCHPSAIALGAGVAELIGAVCFAYLRRGDHVLIAEPAFGEYARATSLHGARPHSVRAPNPASGVAVLPLLAAEITRIRPRLVFIAAPVSHTGEALAPESLRSLANACRAADSLLVLDQSYDAFTAAPLGTPLLQGHTHVLHLRSLTKDHAIAGVRVAFAAAVSDVIDAIERARVPWAASSAAQAAAVAAMSDNAVAHVVHTSAALRAQAHRISTRCAELGMEVSQSSTHFLIIRCGHGRIARERLLAQHGILVRDCASFGLPEWIRVAARTPPDTDALITALDCLLDSNPASNDMNVKEVP